MRRFLFRLYRTTVPRMAKFWCSHWGEKSFLAMIAIFIGVMAALAAAVLHTLVVKLEGSAVKLIEFTQVYHEYWWLLVLLVLPMVGIFLSFLVQRYFGGIRYSKSLSFLILSLNRKRINIPVSETWTHALSSALSVGLGGSAGLEAPSVLAGSAIGTSVGSFFRIGKHHRSLLIGCGAAAAISAIFDSPIAGVLFAAEVLLPEFAVSALVPMMMSSAIAAVVSRLIITDERFFLGGSTLWQTNAIPYYFVCAVVCALVGVYVIRSAYFLADYLKKRFRSPWRRLFVGGTLLSLLLFIFPFLRGQGYIYVSKLFAGDLDFLRQSSVLLSWLPSNALILVIIVAAAIFVKVIVSVLTVDSGGDGGIFAPAMFIGAFTGFAFARSINLTGVIELDEFNFIVVGMCGVFTAVMRAPLTGIFLIAEVTGGYILLVPLMIVSSVSHFTANLFEPHSIYRKALAEKNLLGKDREQSMLRRQAVRLNLDKKYHILRPQDSFKHITRMFDLHQDEVFPVLDEENNFLGMVLRNKIITAMLNPEVCDYLLAFDLMDEPVETLSQDDDLADAMSAFDASAVEHLPVCNKGVFIGFLHKDRLWAKYRSLIKESNNF
ncbi:MAG: chloride channel protein [Victivallaceae bacterium]|nr:chloride channel protein [Victivallaceae bacterium]MDD4180915.1 chloride channel protein [Victivallaceae bacterium]